MTLDSNLFLHESDKAAMKALRAIPGFYQVMKAFMKVWNEQQFKLINMSTNLRLNDTQMAKYYNMLPPICEKLGIEVPEIYVELDVRPNAYTYGDTKPFIVLTSGLFETVPEELIPTVIAHECGHIACHHTLYTTMGHLLLDSASMFVSGLGNIALYPIQLAFAYWMRCSEYSADRAAIICDGSAKNTMNMCMRFAGFDKDIMDEPNLESFIKQAEEYKAMVDESKYNKTLEFILFQNYDHPLNAVRAYEAREWEKTERFKNIEAYLNSSDEDKDLNLPVLLNPKKLMGKNYEDVQAQLMGLGFIDISMNRTTENPGNEKTERVFLLTIDGEKELKEDYYKKDANIEVFYFEEKTEEEIAAEHPGEITTLEGAKYFQGKSTDIVVHMLEEAGFTKIETKEMAIPKFGLLYKEGTVAKVVIGDNDKFSGDDWFDPNEVVVVYSYVSVS